MPRVTGQVTALELSEKRSKKMVAKRVPSSSLGDYRVRVYRNIIE